MPAVTTSQDHEVAEQTAHCVNVISKELPLYEPKRPYLALSFPGQLKLLINSTANKETLDTSHCATQREGQSKSHQLYPTILNPIDSET